MNLEGLIADLKKGSGQEEPKEASQLWQTRAQKDLKRAVELITEFKMAEPDPEARSNFTRRAKDFPALIMQVGLAQALAFSAEKSKKTSAVGRAHAELLRQVGAILGQPDPLNYVQSRLSAAEYMQVTRRIMSAWAYHRRLAVTILGDTEVTHED